MVGMVWPQVIKEPIVKEGDPAMNDPGLRVDSVRGSPRWRRCSIFEWLTLMPHLIGGVHLLLCLIVELLKSRECIAQLWKIGEEILHLLFNQLMAYCSMKPLTLLLVYLPWQMGTTFL